MRVVAGKARGMRLTCPAGREVRPVPDRVREALFNILGDRVPGAVLLDLFAGCGTVGIEALSRGAAWCVFVERSASVARILEENLAHTRLLDHGEVVKHDVLASLETLKRLGRQYDVVFAGPPFPLWGQPARAAELFRVIDGLVEAGLLKEDGVVITQHEGKVAMPQATAQLHRGDTRAYGRNILTFYAREPHAQEDGTSSP